MSGKDNARVLLTMAEKDYQALQVMLDSETVPIEIFGFHVQQTIEKTLKAWIDSLGLEYPLTHNIGRLLSTLEKNRVDVETYWDLIEFNVFAVQYRYEAFENIGEDIDRFDILKWVKELLEKVRCTINEE